jgi:hypothetical protein
VFGIRFYIVLYNQKKFGQKSVLFKSHFSDFSEHQITGRGVQEFSLKTVTLEIPEQLYELVNFLELFKVWGGRFFVHHQGMGSENCSSFVNRWSVLSGYREVCQDSSVVGGWQLDLGSTRRDSLGSGTEKKCRSFKMKKARCKCGWEVGQNLSGDCVDCNAAIAQMPSKRRVRVEPPQVAEEDVFERDKVRRKAATDADKSNGILSKRAQQQEAAAAKKKADEEAKAAKEAADLKAKQDADGVLLRSGFVRGLVVENGSQQANLIHNDWLIIPIPRDGHCLMHCFLRILQMRQPGHVIKTQIEMRCELAKYFEDHGNCLEVVDVGIFECEDLQAMRTGKIIPFITFKWP